MEIRGKIIATPMAKSGVSSRGPWKKTFIVVEYNEGDFKHQLLMSNMKNAEDFGRLSVGQSGTFKFDGSVRDNGGNYYMDLNCWSWNIDQSQNTNAPF